MNPSSSNPNSAWRSEPYDPAWLVDAAKREFPADVWLHEALANCTQAAVESVAYIHFVDPALRR